MSQPRLFTIGVYGTTRESFFQALVDNRITHFVDVRRRRGLRGAQYAYANASALEEKLRGLAISYIHRLDMSPSEVTRNVQRAADAKAKTSVADRETLSPEFTEQYRAEVLAPLDPDAFFDNFPEEARIVLFCVEHSPSQCHRSLLANHLAMEWQDITPT